MKCIIGINNMKFEVTITGFDTKAQAEAFIQWYNGQGEQDAAVWFENSDVGCTSMNVDCAGTFPTIWIGNSSVMVVKPA